MARVYRTPQAETDLLETWLYVAEDNEAAADRLLYRIDERCRELAENPGLGRARSELGRGVRN